MIECVLILYLAIAAATYINLVCAEFLYSAIRPGLNSKDRIKVDKKVTVISNARKYSIVWPYVLFLLLR
jgi:hypothetical protein